MKNNETVIFLDISSVSWGDILGLWQRLGVLHESVSTVASFYSLFGMSCAIKLMVAHKLITFQIDLDLVNPIKVRRDDLR